MLRLLMAIGFLGLAPLLAQAQMPRADEYQKCAAELRLSIGRYRTLYGGLYGGLGFGQGRIDRDVLNQLNALRLRIALLSARLDNLEADRPWTGPWRGGYGGDLDYGLPYGGYGGGYVGSPGVREFRGEFRGGLDCPTCPVQPIPQPLSVGAPQGAVRYSIQPPRRW